MNPDDCGCELCRPETANRPLNLTQDASGDFYPDTKDDTMTTDQPAWATDPRGLPLAVHTEPHELIWILDTANGTYTYHPLSPRTPAQLDREYGPVTPLWSDTPPTPIDPSDIKVGMRVRRVHARGPVVTVEGTVDCTDKQSLTVDGMYLSHGIGDWFLIAAAPDPAAHWIRAIAEATPETAPTVYAAIKGEQA